jgi:formate dehydrogenase iron-sulfur subunit
MSYDNTGQLGANSWRHVAFIEQSRTVDLPTPTFGRPGDTRQGSGPSPAEAGDDVSLANAQQSVLNAEALSEFDPQTGQSGTDKQIRWLMSSDVCKHCTHAGCLDVCPTGALFRTEFGTVVVQGDICNGCGYCVSACPYGVIETRKDDGRAFKCTMCYDRLTDGLMPACATACPTQSIQFGDLDELHARADARLATLQAQGVETARLYGRDEDDGVGGDGAFFLLLDEPEVYGLPPDPIVTTRDLPAMWKAAGKAAVMMVGVAVTAVLGSRRPR